MSSVSLATGTGARRRAAWWGLVLAVMLTHLLLSDWLADSMVGWSSKEAAMPQRIEVAFVQELAQATPPAAPRMPARPKPKRQASAAPPADAASAPLLAQIDPVPEVTSPIEMPAPVQVSASTAQVPVSPAVEAEAASAAAALAPPADQTKPFEWPPSTRLSYKLSGSYRGEVHGSARVQWINLGTRYQVHLDVAVGPSLAPLISRRMTSDGALSDSGLAPQRYDEITRVVFRAPRRVTILLTPKQVTLPNGSLHAAPEGVQDPASQFVQMTWLFTTRPETLRAGKTVTLPLALPRRVDPWIYDVLGEQRLNTPIGEIDTFHLKPRLPQKRPENELSAEVWIAPSLQYLPVRIRIQQDLDTYVDLVLDEAPLQAAPDPVATSPR